MTFIFMATVFRYDWRDGIANPNTCCFLLRVVMRETTIRAIFESNASRFHGRMFSIDCPTIDRRKNGKYVRNFFMNFFLNEKLAADQAYERGISDRHLRKTIESRVANSLFEPLRRQRCSAIADRSAIPWLQYSPIYRLTKTRSATIDWVRQHISRSFSTSCWVPSLTVQHIFI